MRPYSAELVAITRCRLNETTNRKMRRYYDEEGFRGDFLLEDGRTICFFGMEEGDYVRTSPGHLARSDDPRQPDTDILATGHSIYEWCDCVPVRMTEFTREWFMSQAVSSSPTIGDLVRDPRTGR